MLEGIYWQTMNSKRKKMLVENAIGNLYRAAFFLAKSSEEKVLAEQMMKDSLNVFKEVNFRFYLKLKKLKGKIKRIRTRKERLVLAELILDEYKKISGIA